MSLPLPLTSPDAVDAPAASGTTSAKTSLTGNITTSITTSITSGVTSNAPAIEQAPAAPVIIADRGEFIDTLRRLRQGHVLVRPRAASDEDRANCVLDSAIVYTAFQPLARYGLISEFANPDGFPTLRYYRLSAEGKRFADKAVRNWRKRPLRDRLAVRLFG